MGSIPDPSTVLKGFRFGTRSIQPREDSWVATLLRNNGSDFKMSTFIDLTEGMPNSNPVTLPSASRLQSLVSRHGSLGAVSQLFFFFSNGFEISQKMSVVTEIMFLLCMT